MTSNTSDELDEFSSDFMKSSVTERATDQPTNWQTEALIEVLCHT